jgi:acetyl esterase/lipase
MLRASDTHVGSIIADRRGALGNRRAAGAARLVVLVTALTLLGAAVRGPGATAGVAGASCGRDVRGDAVRTVRYETVPGVAPRYTSLDVYPLAQGCDVPVLIWVHGGGWQKGDKANQIALKSRWAAEQGWVLVSVNYRLTDPASATPVVYPAHNTDVAAAVAWVHDHIREYGGDPSRLAVVGHSAGAQIVASIATDERYLAAHGLSLSDLRCAGALDTEGFDVASRAAGGRSATVYRAAFGDNPGTWADASPLLHVANGKGIPSFLVVERGLPTRRAAQERFVDALRDAGVAVTVLDAGALTHGQVNSRIGAPADRIMTPSLVAYLSECFGPS